MEPDEEPGTLTVSGVMHDGFDLSWNLTAHSIYDSFTVEYTDIRQLWDMREVPLPGDVTATSIRGLKALTEYQIKLYGEIQNQRSALLEAVAVTGITAFFRIRDAQCSFLHFKSLKFYFFSNIPTATGHARLKENCFHHIICYILGLFQLLLMTSQ